MLAFVMIVYPMHTSLGWTPHPSFPVPIPHFPALPSWVVPAPGSSHFPGQGSKHPLTIMHPPSHPLTGGFAALGQRMGSRAESDPAGDDVEGTAVGVRQPDVSQ